MATGENRHSTIKSKIREQRAAGGSGLLGLLVRVPSEDLIEMAGMTGFDFVVLDCEHGPADVTELRRHITVAQLQGMATLVRVGSDEPTLVLRALDQGAAGIVAPHLDTADDARTLVDAAHYPPMGRRGFATYTRSGRFGQTPREDHRRDRLAETLVIGMIESPLGVANTAEILRVPGLDGLMVGAADLTISSTTEDVSVAQSVESVHRDLAASDRLRMDIVNSAEQAATSLADGAHLVVYNTAHALMTYLEQLRHPDSS